MKRASKGVSVLVLQFYCQTHILNYKFDNMHILALFLLTFNNNSQAASLSHHTTIRQLWFLVAQIFLLIMPDLCNMCAWF